jgi:hypothetical protein
MSVIGPSCALPSETSPGWPLIGPAAFHALGIMKSKAVQASE